MISGKKNSYRLNSGKKILARKYTWRKEKFLHWKKYIFNGAQCWGKKMLYDVRGKKFYHQIARVILSDNPNHPYPPPPPSKVKWSTP